MTSKPPFLTDDEIRTIADPLKQPAAIVRWFAREGFVTKIKPNGLPLVARSHFEAALSGATQGAAAQEETPDVIAFLEHLKKGQRQHGKNQKKQPARAA